MGTWMDWLTQYAGYDEGGYSASMNLLAFIGDYNLEKSAWKSGPVGLANRVAIVTSFGVLGAALALSSRCTSTIESVDCGHGEHVFFSAPRVT